MKCQDFLPALETGGRWRRRAARRHAARCPRCAAVAERFAAVKAQWADAPPLAAQDRLAWERAADRLRIAGETRRRTNVVPARRRFPFAIVAGLAAAACAAVVVIVIVRHKHVDVAGGQKPAPTTNQVTPSPVASRTSPVRVEVVDPAAELARLSVAVDQLDARMKDLDRQAARAEARRQVASAIDHFGRW
jgi:hypothetical protein